MPTTRARRRRTRCPRHARTRPHAGRVQAERFRGGSRSYGEPLLWTVFLGPSKANSTPILLWPIPCCNSCHGDNCCARTYGGEHGITTVIVRWRARHRTYEHNNYAGVEHNMLRVKRISYGGEHGITAVTTPVTTYKNVLPSPTPEVATMLCYAMLCYAMLCTRTLDL